MAARKNSGSSNAPTAPAWHLVPCPTNERVWNPRWNETRHLRHAVRRGDVLAVNEHGTLGLYRVVDPHDVDVCGKLQLPDAGGLAEDCAIAFIDDARVAMTTTNGIFVVDVSNPNMPKLIGTHETSPALKYGTFVDGALYGSGVGVSGLYAVPSVDAAQDIVRFAQNRSEYGGAGTYARKGAHLYALGSSKMEVYAVDARGMPAADAAPVTSKTINTASAARSLRSDGHDFVVVISGTSDIGVQIVDVAKPDNPKLQKRVCKEEPRGAALYEDDSGAHLLVAHGVYEEHLDLTTLSLQRPQSVVASTVRLTNDPELASGLCMVEKRGDELFVLAVTGRFAVLASGEKT